MRNLPNLYNRASLSLKTQKVNTTIPAPRDIRGLLWQVIVLNAEKHSHTIRNSTRNKFYFLHKNKKAVRLDCFFCFSLCYLPIYILLNLAGCH